MALEKIKTMFDECSKERIPKNLHDCIKQDRVTDNLWSWSHNLEVVGQVILAIILIAGVFETAVTARVSSEVNSGETASMFSAVAVFVKWGLYAIIEYCIYHVLALLVGSLASIVHDTKVTAQIAQLNFNNSEMMNSFQNENQFGRTSINNYSSGININDKPTHKWVCDCGNTISEKPCKYCGKE